MTTTSSAYERFAGWSAIAAGVIGFLYALAFIVIQRSAPALGGFLSALALTLLGFFSVAALLGAYDRLRQTDAAFALWAVLLAVTGALGSLLHGGYDLANSLNPPSAANADLPSQVDPRGLLTFAVAGLGLAVISWLIVKGGRFPRGLGYLGWLSAILLVLLYLGRLIILSPASAVILVPAILNGFLIGPAWYVWLGTALLKPTRRAGRL